MKIAILNIEGDKHMDRVRKFIQTHTCDLYCLQEVFEDTIPVIMSMVPDSATCAFARNLARPNDGSYSSEGILTISLKKCIFKTEYYHHPTGSIPQRFDTNSLESRWRSEGRAIINTEILHDNNLYRIANTHFTWSPDGLPTIYQIEDMKALYEYTLEYPDLFIVGDFNVPRFYNGIYDELCKLGLVDCIPKSVAGSIDLSLHRHKDNPEISDKLARFMVDYVWRKGYDHSTVTVEQIFGASDHSAFIATIELG